MLLTYKANLSAQRLTLESIIVSEVMTKDLVTRQVSEIGEISDLMDLFHQLCLNAGMNDYLSKPIKLDSIKQALLIITNK